MENQIFQDENKNYEFDFSKANWAIDKLHKYFHKYVGSILCDVDFVAETDDVLILVEYKNSKVKNAIHPTVL